MNPNYSGAYYYIDDVAVIDSLMSSIPDKEPYSNFIDVSSSYDFIKLSINKELKYLGVFDVLGKNIFIREIVKKGEEVLIPYSDLSSGMYIITASDGKRIVTKKLIK
jgi:hypothetical protein